MTIFPLNERKFTEDIFSLATEVSYKNCSFFTQNFLKITCTEMMNFIIKYIVL